MQRLLCDICQQAADAGGAITHVKGNYALQGPGALIPEEIQGKGWHESGSPAKVSMHAKITLCYLSASCRCWCAYYTCQRELCTAMTRCCEWAA